MNVKGFGDVSYEVFLVAITSAVNSFDSLNT